MPKKNYNKISTEKKMAPEVVEEVEAKEPNLIRALGGTNT